MGMYPHIMREGKFGSNRMFDGKNLPSHHVSSFCQTECLTSIRHTLCVSVALSNRMVDLCLKGQTDRLTVHSSNRLFGGFLVSFKKKASPCDWLSCFPPPTHMSQNVCVGDG